MKKLMELFKKQSGSVLILVSLAFTGIMGIAGLAIDGGTIYMTKADLQKVANAAALSGAQELTADEQTVRNIVDDVINKHNETSALESVVPTMNETEKSVTVTLNKNIPLPFLKLFGIETFDVNADATASIFAMGRAVGAAPLGVNQHNTVLEYGNEYSLKVASGDSTTGDFGILALEGKGANDYEQTFRSGYSEELAVGDEVLVQTGNIAGATREVVGEKTISTCDENDRECTRIIKILIYEPVCDSPASCTNYREVKITGFAYFYITNPMSATDTSITGRFIKRVGTGFTSGNAVDNGAYVVKLTK